MTPRPSARTDAEIIAEAEAQLGGEGQDGEVIVVTGSAIERTETTTPAPVSVLDAEELDAAGMASIGDILQDLPAQSNAINTQFNNGGDGATRVRHPRPRRRSARSCSSTAAATCRAAPAPTRRSISTRSRSRSSSASRS